jgi:hypothetical protein
MIAVCKPGFWAATLQLTLLSLPGDGPFPVAAITYGTAAGNARWQGRARSLLPSRALVDRGFMVVLPKRQGFWKSTSPTRGSAATPRYRSSTASRRGSA